MAHGMLLSCLECVWLLRRRLFGKKYWLRRGSKHCRSRGLGMNWIEIVVLISMVITAIGWGLMLFFMIEGLVEYRAWTRYHNNNPWGRK